MGDVKDKIVSPFNAKITKNYSKPKRIIVVYERKLKETTKTFQELFESFLSRYQTGLETSIKGSVTSLIVLICCIAIVTK